MSKLIFLSILKLYTLSIILLSTSLQLVSSQCRDHEKSVLLKIKDYFGYSNTLESWNNATDCCFFWEGVYCDPFTYKVEYLYITNSNVSAPIPSFIADLPDLIRLNIQRHPNLTGPIPKSFARLRFLQRLAITDTSLSGSIPKLLCNISRLYSLDLSSNKLSGKIPSCFSGNVHLITLSNNRLSGHLPGNLMKGYGGNDTVLNVHNNRLSGRIPQAFKVLTFDNLDLTDNRFIGDATHLFGSSKFTYQIKLSNNKFAFNLSSVTYPLYLGWLDISHNMIEGSINEQITELQGLGILDMSYNRLCGPIPNGPNMRQYDRSTFLYNKCLCGTPLPPCTA